MAQKILVTGGSGYIGSHTIIDLIHHGYDVISVDSGINAYPLAMERIHEITGKAIHNYPFDLCDQDATEKIFKLHPDITGVIHFAALKAVGESVKQPIRYFRNNLISLMNVLDCVRKYETKHFVFSSSCTVYGNVSSLPVTEEAPEQEAESPYGRTKQMSEKMIQDCLRNTNTSCIALRYFNPAGAHPSAKIGESPINPAMNLVPVITETAIGLRDSMTVYGIDYDTRDGSCIRDYIHIMDLANAHTKALQFLTLRPEHYSYEIFNLGIGLGVSVLEAIHAFEKVSGKKLNYKVGPRRDGDVISIYADYTKAKKLLGWSPQFDINHIMESAWKWENKRNEPLPSISGD